MENVTEKIGEEYKKWKPGSIIHIDAATGSGKTTFILQTYLKYIIQNGGKILYCVNRNILKKQIYERIENEINEYLTELNMEMQSIYDYILVCTYQEIESRISEYINNLPNMVCEYWQYSAVVYDECHYFYSDSTFNTYTELSYDFLRNLFIDKIQIFMSATISNMEEIISKRVYSQRAMIPIISEGKIITVVNNIYKYSIERDYSYIDLSIVSTIEEIEKKILQDTNKEKWLIFTNSKDKGKKLKASLEKEFGEKEMLDILMQGIIIPMTV